MEDADEECQAEERDLGAEEVDPGYNEHVPLSSIVKYIRQRIGKPAGLVNSPTFQVDLQSPKKKKIYR